MNQSLRRAAGVLPRARAGVLALIAAGLLAACASPGGTPSAATDLGRETLAADDGWAAAESGTWGGADARPEHVYEVRNRAELVAALALGQAGGAPSNSPKIVKVRGTIDLSVDDANRPLGYADYRDPAFDFDAYLKAYDPATWGKKPVEGPLEEARKRSAQRQAARTTIRVPSNTTIVGVGRDARIVHGMLLLEKVENVIVRNIHFEDAYDHFPAWDPKDNAGGEWNSEYDNVSLRGATNVWIDHCTFSDGARPDHTARTALGRRMQHHDGQLDITLQSNHVTVSWNHFRDHDKTNLVGGSDSIKADDGKLKVTFHHNLWEGTKERAPRVRYGEVHVYNNLYVADSRPPMGYGYSIGVGFNSRVFSENNVWEASPDVRATALVKLWKGSTFFDRGSLLNGRPVDLFASLQEANPTATLSREVGWQPRLHGKIDDAADVARRVRASAGAGRL
ncbi:pectate lyase family protein [Caldimonas tepidiphila]|uniref:pectate lyase family protein n=1 Tax=Caldimonas tepidiphila TaxID=2315841 RepID=UPI000E5BC153|nr:pectate lyase [Caldimonas tepidiphila]